MDFKDIDKEINTLVMEKKLLQESMKRTKSEEEKKEMHKRIIRINAEIRRTKEKYDKSKDEKIVSVSMYE
jgi:hypothetical protein